MDPIFACMLDTVRIATFQPRAADTRTGRFPPEHELRVADDAAVNEQAPAAARTTWERGRLRGWFRFAFMAR
jgi:hypothetical protein